MDEKDILFTGGSGMLGTAMQAIMPDSKYPSSSLMNVSDTCSVRHFFFNLHKQDLLPKVVVHMAAETACPKIEYDIEKTEDAIMSNIAGTANISAVCLSKGIRLIYISTDYVFNGEQQDYAEEDWVEPINKYGMSKLAGEYAVKMVENSMIIRTSISPDVFPYKKAFNDQYTSRMTVSKFAQELKKMIYREDLSGVYHIGEYGRSVYELAKETSENPEEIEPISRESIEGYPIPENTSLWCQKWKEAMGTFDENDPMNVRLIYR